MDVKVLLEQLVLFVQVSRLNGTLRVIKLFSTTQNSRRRVHCELLATLPLAAEAEASSGSASGISASLGGVVMLMFEKSSTTADSSFNSMSV